jgi:hypothetical protein
MLAVKTKRRAITREKTTLSATVTGRKSIHTFWKEKTEIYSVSKLGAGFTLKRECEVGRILPLILDMPQQHRCYDWDKPLYLVWAVVQYCNPISRNNFEGFQIGVAFVGKEAPQSYFIDPSRGYIISGRDKDGFWEIKEKKTDLIPRSFPRYDYPLQARLSKIDGEGYEIAFDDATVTKNISIGGTAVFSDLEVEIGDFVHFNCPELEFSSECLVRNRQIKEGEPVTLHLSFSENMFPVDKLNLNETSSK